MTNSSRDHADGTLDGQYAPPEAHYDARYFDWQREIGGFAGQANRFKFQSHVRPSDRVLDFGCGGGFLLAAIPCAERKGVEINPVARAEAMRNGIDAVPSSEEVPDDWADVVISNSCLEHCESPLAELKQLLRKLKPGGKFVLVVPHETIGWRYRPGDINQHIYTWSPMALGNLVALAGFDIKSVDTSKLVWPPRVYRFIGRTAGHRALRAASRLYRALRLLISPVTPLDIDGAIVLVAMRPKTS